MDTNRRLSQYRVPQYNQNFDYFDEYCSHHRDHQVEAIAATQTSDKGQIISPCGTGKTRVQVSLHIQGMIDLTRKNESGVFCIASHRLSLNRQLLGDLVEVAIKCGLLFDVLYLGSYKCDLAKYYAKYHHLGYTTQVSNHLATTDAQEIEQFIAAAKAKGRHVIIASTYDSFARLKNIGQINLTTFDEAHNTTQDDFTDNITVVKSNLVRQYYFTATRKVAGSDGGMNNEEFYGKILFDAFPKQMLAAGEIVCPRLHRVRGADDQTTNTTNTGMLVKNIIEAYIRHRVAVKSSSCSPEEIGAKLLVGCNSIEEMLRIYNDIRSMSGSMKVFAISSKGCCASWDKCGKEEFFTKLNAMSDAEDAIIFNVDMLTEGIDLPSITGVMPLRNLGLTKLIQMIGRALRLHKTDRQNLYAGEAIPCDYSKYVKPYGYVVIPQDLATIDHYDEMIKQADLFYSEYGTKAEELIIDEKYVPIEPQTLDTMIPFPFKDGKDYDLEHELDSLVDEINLRHFREDMTALNQSQQAQYISNNFLK